MSDNWTGTIAGERMAVDGEFTERVRESSLTPQQWNLVMTAVSFDVENPDDPDAARLVADTSRLPAVTDELDRVAEATPGGTGPDTGSEGGGLLSSLLGVFGGSSGGGSSDAHVDEGDRLAEEYATRLQDELEERGRWQEIREQVATG